MTTEKKRPGRPKKDPGQLASNKRWQENAKITDFPENGEIHRRFFQALKYLVEKKEIKSVYAFARKYNLNTSNFYAFRDNPSVVPALYLYWLTEEFRISSYWLLTGRGEMIYK